jgi:hypothetical protein
VNEAQADKIIELLERIASSQDTLLAEQRKSDAEMREAMANLPFNQNEDEEKKSTDAFYNQSLVQAATSRIPDAPWSS